MATKAKTRSASTGSKKSRKTVRKALDQYAKAVAYLVKHPTEIAEAWGEPYSHKAGCLFTFVSRNDERPEGTDRPTVAPHEYVGCLTEIQTEGRSFHAFLPELTETIRAAGLPAKGTSIKTTDLKRFAAFQRGFAAVRKALDAVKAV